MSVTTLKVLKPNKIAMESSKHRIYIVDDQLTPRLVLAELIQSMDPSVTVESFDSAKVALAESAFHPPELLITDYRMPDMDGIDLIKSFRRLPNCADVPIIMVTSHNDRTIRNDALIAGATDFLSKPVHPVECNARCTNLLTMHRQHLMIKRRATWLQTKVVKATQSVRHSEIETLRLLARAGEYRDEETGDHVGRMAKYSRCLAEALLLDNEQCKIIEHAAPMHDIGKIGIPDSILLKPGKLTAEETETMQQHTTIGYDMLRDSQSKYVQMGAIIARSHHEAYDGSGYPQGLRDKDIPLPARIVAVADIYDALTNKRAYKEAWTHESAKEYLIKQRSKLLDPECVDAFLHMKPESLI